VSCITNTVARQSFAVRGAHALKLGTGNGTSVLEVVAAVERALGQSIALQFGSRRHGDPPHLVASAVRAYQKLGWVPKLSQIDVIVETALRWHLQA
jgi:UDP-arabinose 4-epimerase